MTETRYLSLLGKFGVDPDRLDGAEHEQLRDDLDLYELLTRQRDDVFRRMTRMTAKARNVKEAQ